MLQNFTIRKVTLQDAPILAEFASFTFLEAYKGMMAIEELESYISKNFNIDVLKKEILDPKASFWFAFLDEEMAGYIKFENKPCGIKLPVSNSGKITRIYTKKKFYGSGLSSILFQKLLQLATEAACEGVWLTVWEKNIRAHRFYEKNGLKIIGNETFQVGSVTNHDFVYFRKL